MDWSGDARRAGVIVSLALFVAACGESVRHAPYGVGGAGAPGDGRPGDSGAEDPRGRSGQLLLLDQYDLPLTHTRVLVNDAVVTTGDDGFAPLPDVGERYDVSAVSGRVAYVFHGLTARAPVVRLVTGGKGEGVSSMSLTMRFPALGEDQDFVYGAGFAGIARDQQFIGTSTEEQGMTLYGNWAGSSVVRFSAEAFIVDVDHDSRAPVAFSGYATQSWDVAPDTDLTWTPAPTPSPFATTAIHVNLSLPSGARFVGCDATAFEPSGIQVHFGPQIGFFDSEDLVVPDLPDTTFDLDVNSANVAAQSGFTAVADGVRAGDDVTLEAHTGPTLLAPDAGAVVNPDTEFSWTEIDGAVYRVFITTQDGDTMHAYAIVTTEPSVRLPDLSALDMPFPSGQTLVWEAFAYEGLALDSFAATGRYGNSGLSEIRRGSAE